VSMIKSCKPTADPVNLSRAGDAGDVIFQMKRAAHLETDGELANLLGRKQSAVSQWRKRNAVPEAAILRFHNVTSAARR